jgi:hypothetical protein
MRIDPEELRRHYESLSDEGLLDIDRSDLNPVAQGIYDQEIARRGLNHTPEQEEEEEEEVYHRPLPVTKPGKAWDFASELGFRIASWSSLRSRSRLPRRAACIA